MDTPFHKESTTFPISLSPHVAKSLFRSLLPLFRNYWQETRHIASQDANWHDYLTILHVCQDVLDHAPMHPNEIKQANAERLLEQALEQLATTLHHVMPGGLPELEGYVVADPVHARRRRTDVRFIRQLQPRHKQS